MKAVPYLTTIFLLTILSCRNNSKPTKTAKRSLEKDTTILQSRQKVVYDAPIVDITNDKDAPDRKQILDAIRPEVEKELKQPVKIRVRGLSLMGNFAFLNGVAKNAKGQSIDYASTVYARQVKEGFFDDNLFAICKKENGNWKCLQYYIGCTDACFWEWPDKYGLSKKLFGLDE